jgi:hypothetical protein
MLAKSNILNVQGEQTQTFETFYKSTKAYDVLNTKVVFIISFV